MNSIARWLIFWRMSSPRCDAGARAAVIDVVQEGGLIEPKSQTHTHSDHRMGIHSAGDRWPLPAHPAGGPIHTDRLGYSVDRICLGSSFINSYKGTLSQTWSHFRSSDRESKSLVAASYWSTSY